MEQPDALKELLDAKVQHYNRPAFIKDDPISIPHSYQRQEDIEIAGLFAAVLAWGHRTTIINSSRRLMALMGNKPFEFVMNHNDADLKSLLPFVHRTFQAADLLYFIHFLQHHYSRHTSLEDAFVPDTTYNHSDTGEALTHFQQYFFSLEHLPRTRKHIPTPERNSACKRLNMYLRWMVRNDGCGVDFGLWKKISPAQLVCPLDVHVARVAQRLGMLDNKASNWKNALHLTQQLRELDPNDPVRYDYALFSMGVVEHF